MNAPGDSTATVNHSPHVVEPTANLHEPGGNSPRSPVPLWIVATITLIVAIAVLAGWWLRIEAAVQVLPGAVPMQANTAIGFLFVGVALLLLGRRPAWSCGLATAAGALGLLTLVQYASGISLGIDTWLVDPWLTTKTSHPGRMAPNTAVGFILVALAVLSLSERIPANRRTLLCALCSVLAASLGGVALFGYVTGLETAYGWHHVTQMAVHTAAGFAMIGTALLWHAWSVEAGRGLPHWTPVPIIGAGVTLSLLLYLALDADQREATDQTADMVASNARDRIADRLTFITDALARMAHRQDGNGETARRWHADASVYLHDMEGLSRIAWFDEDQRMELPTGRPSAPPLPLAEIPLGHDRWYFDGEFTDHLRVFVPGDPAAPALQGVEATLDLDWLGDGVTGLTWTHARADEERVARERLELPGVDLVWHPPAPPSSPASLLPWVTLTAGLLVTVLLAWLVALARRLDLDAIELRRSNEELDAFAYIASHDLKEPLRGIQSYARFLQQDYREVLDDDGLEMLDTLPQLAGRMERFLNTLLHYSRLGRQRLDLHPVELDTVVDEALDNLATLVDESAVQVRRHALPVVRCDAIRTAEVFQNLLSNAIRYQDASKEIHRVEVGCLPHSGTCFVRDNGIGIPAKHQDKIFRIFQRLHHQDEYGGGTGAGLTITRKIVERHGGRIWVESTPGMGTTFFFHFGAGSLVQAAATRPGSSAASEPQRNPLPQEPARAEQPAPASMARSAAP